MKYNNIVDGKFLKRINRFIAEVEIDGTIEIVHVKNTGRCKELFIDGSKVFLQKSDNPDRKTKYSLISIYKKDMLINIDSQIPNYVVFENIIEGRIENFKDIEEAKREVKYGNSRFDIFYRRSNGKEGFIEVKGVTLENSGIAMFPDAPTERGRKHINEMIKAVEEGYEGNIFFLIQIENINTFTPNDKTDPKFGYIIRKAYEKGVNVYVYNCINSRDSIDIKEKVENILF